MPNASQSSVQEAIAAIIERRQREGIVPPEYISRANRLWIDRNRSKHLEPVFAEVARKIGLDKDKLDEAVARHQQEVTQYLKEREAETDKNFAALVKIYREALANRKAALEGAITTDPSIAPPRSVLMVLDKPDIIYGWPSDLLTDEHIESWNSSTKIIWETETDIHSFEATFYFSWLNDSNNDVVITGVTSSIAAAGRCLLHVDPSILFGSYTSVELWPAVTVFVGQTEIAGSSGHSHGAQIAFFENSEPANLFGGTADTDTHEVFKTVNVSYLQEIFVPRRQSVVFAVKLEGLVWGWDAKVELRFDREPFVHCPSLTVAFQQPLIAFSEGLVADDGRWEGYCLVQRIEPVRLSRSGTQVKLTLRASSISSASIDRIYISQADPAGEPFDSAGDLTAVTSAPIVIPAGTEVTLPAVNYNFDRRKPLLIAVDFSAAPASGLRGNGAVPPAQARAYFKLGTAAATANRTGFTAYPGLYLVESIEVF